MAHGSCLYNAKSGKAEAPTSYAKEVQRFKVCMPQKCQCTIGLVVGQTQSHKTQACMNPKEINIVSTTFLQISRGIQVLVPEVIKKIKMCSYQRGQHHMSSGSTTIADASQRCLYLE